MRSASGAQQTALLIRQTAQQALKGDPCHHADVAPHTVGLQALCFMEAGRTYVPAKPWNPGEESKWVAAPHLLHPTVRQFVDRFRSQQAPAAAAGDAGT
jgi:hypothetical protein